MKYAGAEGETLQMQTNSQAKGQNFLFMHCLA